MFRVCNKNRIFTRPFRNESGRRVNVSRKPERLHSHRKAQFYLYSRFPFERSGARQFVNTIMTDLSAIKRTRVYDRVIDVFFRPPSFSLRNTGPTTKINGRNDSLRMANSLSHRALNTERRTYTSLAFPYELNVAKTNDSWSKLRNRKQVRVAVNHRFGREKNNSLRARCATFIMCGSRTSAVGKKNKTGRK